jgi:hypothetical protein
MNTFLSAPLSRSSPVGDCVAIPFTVREPHHERDCFIINSSIDPFATSIDSVQALSLSKGSEYIATQSLEGEGVFGQRPRRVNVFLSLFAIILLFPISAQSGEPVKEKIAFAYAAISPTMAGVWMAKEIGAFDRQGLNVDLVHISSGAVAIQALVGGSVQAALGASNAVLAAIVKGAPIIAVGSNTSRPGMQLWVQPEIQRPEQLQG